MADEVQPPPLEIPWQLASTTQPLAAGDPDETAVSLFVYAPADEEIASLFPGQRVTFLKLTTSISPAAFPPGLPAIAGAVLGEGVPCFHVLLDVRVRNGAGDLGTTRPYVHAAAPLERRTLQSGIVGLENVEGESDRQHVGRSGSELYESSSTRATTTSVGANASLGYGPLSIGGSARTTATDVQGERAVSQVVDTTSRDASQERRELTSHHTRVENILTLLSAKYVGTPHLRFSLSPRPLQLLSVDPSDSNLWFNQLLQRRSSGIEGIQEFIAVVLVPTDEDFCITARLRRVCVLDDPPGPLAFNEPFVFSGPHLGRALAYLHRRFPVGTPLEDFDVDLLGLLPTQENFSTRTDFSHNDDWVRPVLRSWVVSAAGNALADVVSPTRWSGGVIDTPDGVNYKHFLEIWKETVVDEYERDVARSPLERGVLLGEDRVLDTCFEFTPGGIPVVSGTSVTVTPMYMLDVDDPDLDLGGVSPDASPGDMDSRRRGFETVSRWNLLEERLAVLLRNRRVRPGKDFALDDSRVVRTLIAAWSKLRRDDRHNLSLDETVDALGLTEKQRRALKSAGVTDLRGVAQAIQSAPELALHNDRVRARGETQPADAPETQALEPIKAPISQADAESLPLSIGKKLERARSEAGSSKQHG